MVAVETDGSCGMAHRYRSSPVSCKEYRSLKKMDQPVLVLQTAGVIFGRTQFNNGAAGYAFAPVDLFLHQIHPLDLKFILWSALPQIKPDGTAVTEKEQVFSAWNGRTEGRGVIQHQFRVGFKFPPFDILQESGHKAERTGTGIVQSVDIETEIHGPG